MFQKYLILDLINIIGKYIDQNTYNTLIQLNSNIFNKDKLFKNQLNNIPKHELELIAKAYEYGNNFFDKPEYNIFSLGTFIKLVKKYKILNENIIDNNKIFYTRMYTNEENNNKISGYIEIENDDNISDINLNLKDVSDVYEKFPDDQKRILFELHENEFKNSFNYRNLNKCLIIEKYEDDIQDLIKDSIQYLILHEPDFYPSYNIDSYIEKIIAVTKDKIKKKY